MKVETPQILWNCEEDKGINAALTSVSILRSGVAEPNNDDAAAAAFLRSGGGTQLHPHEYGSVLATAGNTNVINLWRVHFHNGGKDYQGNNRIFQKPPVQQRQPHQQQQPTQSQQTINKIEYICSLTRHDHGPVNTVQFSPNGLHLATAGEAGVVIVWSVPVAKRGNGNGRHYWSTITREQDLTVRIVTGHAGDGVCDLSWSMDSKRFMAGTIDHAVFVCEDTQYELNRTTPRHQTQVDTDWRVVYKNGMDHTHFVQGVAYDPLGGYLASMSSDRSVRIHPRKLPTKSKKKVLRPNNSGRGSIPPLNHQRMLEDLLTESKVEFGRSKELKYRRMITMDDGTMNQHETGPLIAAGTAGLQITKKCALYADESTLESFVRRLCWTVDGAFLLTPAALWHRTTESVPSSGTTASPPAFATLMFARHRFDEPYRILTGIDKPSVAVRANPVLFTLPVDAVPTSPSDDVNDNVKENNAPTVGTHDGIPYRSIFAVLTWDTVLIYDTFHSKPLSIIRGLHYANLVDATWSDDGHNLLVCSTDGYISIINFANGELGQVYHRPPEVVDVTSSPKITETNRAVQASFVPASIEKHNPQQQHIQETPPLPPVQDSVTLEAPPAKKAKTRIAPTLVLQDPVVIVPLPVTGSSSKRTVEDAFLGEAVNRLSLDNTNDVANVENHNPKKKKRIHPILLTSS